MIFWCMEKIALIELSNSSLRLSIYKVLSGDYFLPIKRMAEDIAIDEHLDGEKLVKSPKFKECQTLIQMFKKICECEGVSRYLCFASSTIMNAKNYQSFVDDLGRAVGLTFKVLSDEEEVATLFTATTNTLDIPKGIIVNISSSSTRILHYNRRIVLDSVTLPYGSYSVLKATEGATDPVRAAIDFFKKELSTHAPFLREIDPESTIVGIGDVMTSFGKLARKITKYPVDIAHNYQTDKDTFNQVLSFLKGLNPEKKQKLKGISNQPASNILFGLCIAEAIMETSGLDQITISKGYRNVGLMFQNIIPSTTDRPLPDLLIHSLDTIMTNAGLDKREGMRIYDLSLILFKQLKALHRLPRIYARILKTCAFLGGLSRVTGVTDTEKGNFSLILNLPLYGLSHREQVMSAFVSSCRKWEDFNLSEWVKYKDIMEEGDLEAVKKLSNIMALSIALNIRNQDIVKDITCDILGESAIIKLVADLDGKAKLEHDHTSIEIYQANKLVPEFQKAFKMNLDVL